VPAVYFAAVSPSRADPPEATSEAAPSTPTPQPLRYTLQGIDVRGNTRTRSRVVLRYVPLRPGDVLDVNDPEVQLIRYRLLGTGFFSDVQLSLRKGDERGAVILVIDVVERNTIVVNDVWMGLASDRPEDPGKIGQPARVFAYGGVDVAETNLAGAGITLGAALGVGQDQLALRTRFVDPAFLGTGWMASASLMYNDARDYFGSRDVLFDNLQPSCRCAIVSYTRFGGTIGAGHDLSVVTQLWGEARLEKMRADVPLAASEMRGLDREPISFGINPGASVLSTLRGTLLYDTRDDPILPTRGFYVNLHGDTSIPFASDYQYTKLQLTTSKWWSLPWKHIARLELDYGAVTGNAPFFEKFYIGDFTDLLPDRVLDLNFDRRNAPNLLRTDIVEVRYGDYAAKLQGEYRIPVYRGHRAVYGIDLYGAAGLYGVASYRDLTDPPRGYHGLRRIPIDLTFNLGFRIETSAGGFNFAFSNLLGLVPVRGEGGP
jgi:outer membrane protein insertion porin family